MANAQVASSTVPLDQKVWHAWLEKNRRKEKRFEARLRQRALIIGALLVTVIFLWMSRRA